MYDGLGRNVKIVETESGSVTGTKQFVWNREIRCEERDGGDALTKRFFTYGKKDNGVNRFYAMDHLGSIIESTDSNADVVTRYAFGPFGESTRIEGNEVNDFQFIGVYWHERSALNQMLFRHLNARLGRWISRDPIGENDGPNLFAYVANSPICYIDPSGLDKDAKPKKECSAPCDATPTRCLAFCWAKFIFMQCQCFDEYDEHQNPVELSKCLSHAAFVHAMCVKDCYGTPN